MDELLCEQRYTGLKEDIETLHKRIDKKETEYREANIMLSQGIENVKDEIKKLGFKYEGRRKEKLCSKADKKIKDEIVYGMLKKEWTK